MKRTFLQMLKELRLHWKNYIFQSLAATAVVFLLMLFINLQENPIIIASIGATTFVVFATPKSDFARPRSIIGGHLTGLLCGLLGSLIPHESANVIIISSLIYACSIGAAIFVMVVIDTEHPAAAGTALSVAMTGVSLNLIVCLIISVVVLALTHVVFKNYLKDLT